MEKLPIIIVTDRILPPYLTMPIEINTEDYLQFLDDIEYLEEDDRHICIMYEDCKTNKIGTKCLVLDRGDYKEKTRLLSKGINKVIIKGFAQTDPYTVAEVEEVEDTDIEDQEMIALMPQIVSHFNKLCNLSGNIPIEMATKMRTLKADSLKNINLIINMTAHYIDISNEQKYEILITSSLSDKAKIIMEHLIKKLEMYNLGEKLAKDTKEEINKRNQDYYLKTQRELIDKQLTEDSKEEKEVDEYERKIEERELPEEALKEARNEIKRIKRMHPASHEYSVILSYLDWILEFPWNESTEDKLDISEARKKLEDDHYGLDKPKKRMLEYLAVRQLNPESRSPILCFSGNPGTGKAQPYDAKILTKYGFKKMGDINLGDKILTPSGEESEVVGIFPQGVKDIFRITFSDGASTECCDEHLWKVQNKYNRRENRYRIIELKDIKDNIFKGNGIHRYRNYSIDTVAKIGFKEKSILEIDPYLIGFFISDGHGGRNSLSKKDKEIIKFAEEALIKIDCKLSKDNEKDYRIVKINHTPSDNANKNNNKSKFQMFLEETGLRYCLSENKFIPKEYMISSFLNRERLLQGILDGDGSPIKDVYAIEWSSASKKLSDDLTFLVQSLGGQARYSKGTSFYTYKGKKLNGKDRNRLRITLPSYIKPFRCSKKLKIYKSNLHKKRNLKRYIDKIEYIGKKKARCILIDHPDHLYITNDFIITHNTSICISIAEAMGRKFQRISVGGIDDATTLIGFKRTYLGSMPGRIIQAVKRAGTNNPIIAIDEIDKLGQSHRGDPASALLEALDPEQNNKFVDHYINVAVDLSKVIFICTANFVERIPPALKDRMEIINFPGYSQYEKEKIAEQFLIPKQVLEHGLSKEQIHFSKGSLDETINGYTKESGVRNLEREIANICRGVACRIIEENIDTIQVTKNSVKRYLDIPKFETKDDIEITRSGMSIGMFFSQYGGGVLFVEASKMPKLGKYPKFTTSGSLGDVINESITLAIDWLRSECKLLEHSYHDYDIHIHIPEGARPIEGPSAGVAILTALYSLFNNEFPKKKTSMTGEITLRGKILPVGGIKEKVLGAHRAGIENVILPEKNRKNLKDIPKDVRNDIDFYFADRMENVLDIVFNKFL